MQDLKEQHEVFEYLLDEYIRKGNYYCGSIAYNDNTFVFSEKKDKRIDLRREFRG